MLELALHILDILQNTVEADASTVMLSVLENVPADRLTITVVDDGRGMDERTVERALSPFFTTRTSRHVGLGLPLFAAAAEAAGGGLTIRSQPGRGTTVEAVFRLSHPDRQPLGDLASTLLIFLMNQRAPALSYHHGLIANQVHASNLVCDREFSFDTAAIRAELGDIPLNHPRVAEWLAGMIAEGESELIL